MFLSTRVMVVGLTCWALSCGAALAESKVTVKNVHLCCPACLNAVKKTLGELDGVSHVASQKEKTIAITAGDDKAAQGALDALADAGFHGKIDSETLKFKLVEAPKGNVERLELTGVHNCCGACTRTITGAIKKVDGTVANTVKPRQSSFVVEGNFSAAALIEALLNEGFHVKVKK